MTHSFRSDVQLYLKVTEERRLFGVYGLRLDKPVSNGDTAAATFWYSEDEIMAIVSVSESGFTAASLDRALILAECEEESAPTDAKGFCTAVLAVRGNYEGVDTIEIDGYEIWHLFGYPEFSLFGVSRAA